MGEVGFEEYVTTTDSGGRVYVRQVYGEHGAYVGISRSGDEPELLLELDYDALEKLMGVLDSLRLPRCSECDEPCHADELSRWDGTDGLFCAACEEHLERLEETEGEQ